MLTKLSLELYYIVSLRDITELNVEVNLPDSNITENVAVSGRQALGISRLRTINIPNVWGTLNVHASGAGQAVVQLDTNHGIDYEPYKVCNSPVISVISGYSLMCFRSGETGANAIIMWSQYKQK